MNPHFNISAILPILGLGGFSLDFKGSLIILIVLVALSLGWAAFAYRHTLPPTGIVLRLILGFLRASALLVLIFLIFEPSIVRHRELQLKALVVVIFDDSESMKMKDASGERGERLAALMDDPAWTGLSEKFDLVYFAAGDSLRSIEEPSFDLLQLNAIGTDLAAAWKAALKEMNGEEYAACVLVSDGGNNAGRDPVQAAREATLPIFSVGIGDTARVPDSRITSLVGGEIGYAGKKSRLTVGFKARGMERQTARLELLDPDGRILASLKVNLPPDNLETESTLEFTPERVGTLPLKVQLVTAGEEWSTVNNLRSFLLEVRESRIRVLQISGHPNFEATFFQQAARRIPDLEVTSLTIKKDGGIYARSSTNLTKALAQSDVLVLLDFPQPESSASVRARLRRAAVDHPLPTWIWAGRKPLTEDLQTICGDLPFKISPMRRHGEATAAPARFYAELDPDAESAETPLWWDLPPLQAPSFSIQLDNKINKLINLHDSETGQDWGPALISWEAGGRRLAASFGFGYWRWNFMNLGLAGSNEIYTGLLSRVMRWLAAPPQTRPLRLSPERKLYSSGEAVGFNAQVLGGDGRAITSAQVEIQLQGPEGTSKILLEPDQYGRYSGAFQPEGLGAYSFYGLAKLESDTIGADSGKFLVEAYNVEKEALSQNRSLLEAIAEASGGMYIPADSLAELGHHIEAQPRIVSVDWSRRFFLNWDLWILLVFLLGLEWFIRKRRGML